MKVLHEPLLHFLMLGALVFAGSQLAREDPRFVIDASEAQRARLASLYVQQYGTTPTVDQLSSLLGQYVRSEVLYREGLALGLDRDDEIVRRRIIQKMEFLNQDEGAVSPREERLQQFFRDHRDRYRHPPSVSFVHLYYSPDAGGDERAKERARHALRLLAVGKEEASGQIRGDLFTEGNRFAQLDPANASRIFGASSLAEGLFQAPVGAWSGPYRSGLGWHLVRVIERKPGRPATLDEVRLQLSADAELEARERRDEAAYRRLEAKYRINTNADGRAT